MVDTLIREYSVIPIVVGGAGDRSLADNLLHRWKNGLNATGQLSVREGIALLNLCKLYLGNDTGPMHMAVAAGIPCVAIFSSIDMPGRWEPYGSSHYVFREDMICSGCLLRSCNKGPDRCIERISPRQVYKKCEEYLLAHS